MGEGIDWGWILCCVGGVLCDFGDGGTSWVGKTEDFGNFVETFANGVVASGADNFKMVVALHMNNLGVSARDN